MSTLLIILVVVALRPEVMLFILFLTYATLGAIAGVLRLGKNRKLIKASVYAPETTTEHDLQEETEDN